MCTFLGCAPDKDSIANAVSHWGAMELDEAAADKGHVFAIERTARSVAGPPSGKQLAHNPSVENVKIDEVTLSRSTRRRTSALVKLIRREPESDDLAEWLDAQPCSVRVVHPVKVELVRALRRTEPALIAYVPAVIARLKRYEIAEVVRAAAAAYPDPELRWIDAIHLAAASAFSATGSPASLSMRRCHVN
ncbi:MAG TPA: PIN domain-containing protein [Mycobacterium sp.]|nr:PIN domain-containing protein [Mycobacterium sp.]HUH69818.1 PIN domain-containing protein [Mycobacterium sp.]